MSDTIPTPIQGPSYPDVVPQKRPLGIDDKHAPTVASPLNPDLNATQKRTRDQREKKATYKARGASPEPLPSKKSKKPNKDPSVLSPIRYTLPTPKLADFDSPKQPLLAPGLQRAGRQYYEVTEHISNKRNFRYTRCICDPRFPFSQYHRQSETEPYGPRISFEDTSPHVQHDQSMKSITTEKGFRLARANVGCREGRWYYECKITSGIKSPDAESASNEDSGGHVRLGWARREASLDGPVGFDAYSYGFRDVGGQKVHMSRPKDFTIPATDFCQGDVVGLELCLPSISLHRKVVSGVYNKAVDVTDDQDPSGSLDYPDAIRDRIPIRYKNHLYFEQFEYHPTKDLEELMNPNQSNSAATGAAGDTDPPNPNHPQVPLRALPFSSIKVYKNGQLLGTPFTDLLAFLPPASKPINTAGAREGVDDGMLGYFPAVSVFRGGAVETNFGPDFWFPPPDLVSFSKDKPHEDNDGDVQMTNTENKTSRSRSSLRPVCERFDEQIAEDVVYDIIDEVDFWAQDGGELSQDGQALRETGAGATPEAVSSEAPGTVAAATAKAAGVSGEIKSIIQQEE